MHPHEEQRLHVDRRVHRRSGGEELLRVGHLLSSRAANLAQLNERPPMRGKEGLRGRHAQLPKLVLRSAAAGPICSAQFRFPGAMHN